MTRLVGGIVALALFAGLAAGVRDYIVDDTYIHLQFAKHLREGYGLVFNVGDPVPGTTSPLWSMLLGWVPTFGLDLVPMSKLLSSLIAAAALLFFYRAATGFFLRATHALAATIAWSANAWMVRWSASGMETALATSLVVLGWLMGRGSHQMRAGPPRRLAVGFVWGLAALARPEAGFLVALYVIASVVWPDGPELRAPLRARLAAGGAAVLGGILALLPFVLYSYVTYGSLIPGTLAAKAAGGVNPAVALSRLIQSAKIVGAVCTVEVLAIAILLPKLGAAFKRGDPALHAASWAWLLLIPLGYAVRGVPVISRYLVPLLPLVVLYGWFALEQWRLVRDVNWRRVALVGALVLSVFLNVAVYSYQVVPHTKKFVAGMEKTLIPWGKWLRENTDPNAVVATPDIGAIGYYSQRRVLDLGGLVSPKVVPLMQRMPYDELVRSFAFREVGHPAYLVDRGYGPARLVEESPFGMALHPIFSERTQSLGITKPLPVDYTLYEIDWSVVESIEPQTDVAIHPR